MKFPVQVMRDIARDESVEYVIIDEKIVDTDRWSIQYEVIFKNLKTGKYYRTYWQRGATEMQDEQPFEYDKDDVSCNEVELVEVMVKQWRRVK